MVGGRDERRGGRQYFSTTAVGRYILPATRCVDAGHVAFNSVLVARKADYIATRDAEKAHAMMDGRKFGGRTVESRYIDAEEFDEVEKRKNLQV